MSAHVLLNLLNKLWKGDQTRGLSSILSLFHNEFNKFNNTGARKLDSIYHMTSKLIKISFLCENLKKLFGCHCVKLLNLYIDFNRSDSSD